MRKGSFLSLMRVRLSYWWKPIPNTGITAKHSMLRYTYRSETQNGDVLIKAHPAAAMKADAWKRIRAMLAEFGMSPASRAKVNTAGPDNVDPLAELLKARD